jgi:hypothetical protein
MDVCVDVELLHSALMELQGSKVCNMPRIAEDIHYSVVIVIERHRTKVNNKIKPYGNQKVDQMVTPDHSRTLIEVAYWQSKIINVVNFRMV